MLSYTVYSTSGGFHVSKIIQAYISDLAVAAGFGIRFLLSLSDRASPAAADYNAVC